MALFTASIFFHSIWLLNRGINRKGFVLMINDFAKPLIVKAVVLFWIILISKGINALRILINLFASDGKNVY